MLSSYKSNIFVSIKVHLASVYEKMLSSVGVTFSRGLISKSIVCWMCVMFSSDVSCGMNNKEKFIDLHEENDEIEIKVKKVPEAPIGSIKAIYKVMLLGDQVVGKTQILNRIKNNSFSGASMPTIGVDFSFIHYKCTIKNDENQQFIKLQIWDTSGQERFQTITTSYIQQVYVVVLVYDITNEESFKNIQTWIDIAQKKPNKDALYFLVGNKADLEDKWQVQKNVAQEFAMKNNIEFLMEVSAKDGNNIDNLFEEIVRTCIKKHIEYHEDENTKTNEYSTNDNILSNHNEGIHFDLKGIQIPQPSKNKRCNCCPCCNKDKEDE